MIHPRELILPFSDLQRLISKFGDEGIDRRVKERTAELEAFCYSVSHDLRAPIRRIAPFAQLVREGYEPCFDEEGKRMMQIIVQSSHRLDDLLNDLLGLSRLSLKEMQRQSVNLSASVQTITDGLRKAEPQRKVEIAIMPNLMAEGDQALLSIALENLLNHAWKFTAKRADGRIEFGTELHENQWAYFVRDNGVGFDMTHIDKLFGVFERLHSDGAFPGTGIGLAIVQRVIDRHRGRIWATSQADGGTTLYFTLPG